MSFTSIGQFGEYNVGQLWEHKKMFVPKTERDPVTGEETTTTVPIKRSKLYIQLTHACGAIVVFSTYLYQGKRRWKDSRAPKKSEWIAAPVVEELMRMTGMAKDEATKLLLAGD